MANMRGFFRQSAGPGWVLVGDAGHFKDPTPGQGIADALRQAERLAREIERALGGGNGAPMIWVRAGRRPRCAARSNAASPPIPT
jgi:flavin-dependent dehydrogenase